MVQIKTSLAHEKGKTRASSFGKLTFDENGVAEVESQEIADALVAASKSLHFIQIKDEDINPQRDLDPLAIKPSDPITLPVDAGDDIQKTVQADLTQDVGGETIEGELGKALEDLSMSDLREVLTKGGVPSEEWNELKGKEAKPKLIELILSKNLA